MKWNRIFQVFVKQLLVPNLLSQVCNVRFPLFWLELLLYLYFGYTVLRWKKQ